MSTNAVAMRTSRRGGMRRSCSSSGSASTPTTATITACAKGVCSGSVTSCGGIAGAWTGGAHSGDATRCAPAPATGENPRVRARAIAYGRGSRAPDPMEVRTFHKLLCSNRGEIAIRVFRACTELGIRTVAIFSEEDATNQHRYKADESYLVGKGKGAVQAYLDQDEILAVAKKAKADAIHPGYGFLRENPGITDAMRRTGIAL